MTRLLHLDTSPSPYSVSRKLATSFREVWDKEQPNTDPVYRDLAKNPVPHLDTDAFFTLMEEPQTERQKEASKLHDELVTEILSADALLISAPMHNWNIPSNLKAWLDQSLILGRTLPFDPSVKPLGGRPATVLLAYGGDYGADSPDADMDHCGWYLRIVLERVLGYELEIITASHTLAPYVSQDPAGAERAALSFHQAESAVLERAKAVAGALDRA